MTSSSLRAAERSRYPLLSLTSFHQSCPATALAICSHVSSKLFSWLHVGCTRTTKQAFTISIIADISTINHSAPSGTRTHTVPILSRLPLPIGLWGQRKLRRWSHLWPSSGHSRKHLVLTLAEALTNTEINSKASHRLPSTRHPSTLSIFSA